jgi:hypothetical protein
MLYSAMHEGFLNHTLKTSIDGKPFHLGIEMVSGNSEIQTILVTKIPAHHKQGANNETGEQ